MPENVAGVLASVAPVAGDAPASGDAPGTLVPFQPAAATQLGWQLQLATAGGLLDGAEAGIARDATAGTVVHG